jgi:hypothetical protein
MCAGAVTLVTQPCHLQVLFKASYSRMERCVKECTQCGADMIAPASAEHLSDHRVRNVWSCEACGYEVEDLVDLSAQATDCWSD